MENQPIVDLGEREREIYHFPGQRMDFHSSRGFTGFNKIGNFFPYQFPTNEHRSMAPLHIAFLPKAMVGIYME